MKQAFLLLVIVASGAIARADEVHSTRIPGADPTENLVEQILPPSGLSVPARPLGVRYEKLTGFTTSLRSKLMLAKSKMEKIFASKAFYDAVMNHKYGGKKTFVQNDGYSNEQIYDLIQAGKENFSKQIDRMMNLELKSYYENSNEVGYTYTNSRTIYVNRKFYAGYTSSQIARNLMHEWLHKIGFSHDVGNTSRRPYSVPYAIGSIVERLAKTM